MGNRRALTWAGLVFLGLVVVGGRDHPETTLIALGLAALVAARGSRGRVRRIADRAFLALFTLFTAVAALWLVAGFVPFLARISPAVDSSLIRWGGGVAEAQVTAYGDDATSAESDGPPPDPRDVEMKFQPVGLALRANTDVALRIRNEQIGVPHNLSLYTDRTSTTRIYQGEVLAAAGPERPTEVTYRFESPDPGTYHLQCDLHPWMWGKVTVAAAPTGPGTWPLIGDYIRNATTAELRAMFGDIRATSVPVLALEYLFSLLNLTLAVLLMRFRPHDLTARLLALGMVGTGAVFNVQAHTALAVIPGLQGIHYNGFHGVAGLTYMLAVILFPDGRLRPSWRELPRWRWPLRAAFLFVALQLGLFTIGDSHGKDPFDYILIFGIAVPVVGLVAQIGKTRHATDELERRQSRLLATTLLAAFAGALTYGILVSVLATSTSSDQVTQLRDLIIHAFPALFAAIPLILFAILIRFRLWDMDRLINRGFVYGGLAGFIGVAYVGTVVLGSEFVTRGRNDLWLSVLATGIVAVGFQPLRDRLGALANRLVYGQRETPYEILARFSGRVAETYAGDDVLSRMARMVAEGTSAARSEVWVVVADQLVRAAAWPPMDDGADGTPGRVAMTGDELPAIPGADLAVAVRLRGEVLGALTVTAQRDDPLTPEAEHLLEDLASQAGLVLRNIGLTEQLRERLRVLSRQTEELRDSRQRIVSAQDAERRRMERDIHDGAQQHLVALAVKLRLARTVAERDPQRTRPLLDELRHEVDDALETLRNLARGIYPAVLLDQGLVAAVRSAAERSPLDVRVTAEGLGRYPQDVETAVYFCCLEALQNAAKYSRATVVSIALRARGAALEFTIDDDGVGFDPASQIRGLGLQNMTDRLASLNGEVVIESSPGRGTRVRGVVPVGVMESVG